MKTKIVHHAKIYNLSSKNSTKKKTKILGDIYNSIITNLKFKHKPKYHLSKSSIQKNRSIIYLLPRGQYPFKLPYTLYNESQHNILLAFFFVGKANKLCVSFPNS
jgi:hypothetical protein